MFGAWWIGILLWAAYKLDLWPDSLNPNIPELQTSEVEVDGIEKHKYAVRNIQFRTYFVDIVQVSNIGNKICCTSYIFSILSRFDYRRKAHNTIDSELSSKRSNCYLPDVAGCISMNR